MHEKIIILDFGSQYTQLIARKIRELQVYSEIAPCTAQSERFADDSLIGIILSGGPASVLDEGSPRMDERVLQLGVPILGICYGMQLTSLNFGGNIGRTQTREYGRAAIKILREEPLFSGVDSGSTIWMSHGDHVEKLPDGFIASASTESLPIAAFQNDTGTVFGLQFHPEVHHTEQGKQILWNFLHNVCHAKCDWSMASFIQAQKSAIRERVGDDRVLLGLSGGVDSAVTAALLH